MTHLISTPLTLSFFVADIDGTTPLGGLVNGDFAKTLHANGVASGVTATVSEIGSGFYKLVFTPNAAGSWYTTVRDPLDVLRGFHVEVESFDVGTEVATVRKTATNRLEIDFDEQELVLYDDDGTTPFQRWDLEAEDGDVLAHAGVQTKRKAPKL